MNFIQGWGEGDLNNKEVVATYQKSDFLSQVVIPYTHKIFMRAF